LEKAGLPQHRKDYITVPKYRKGYRTNCGNDKGISLLPTRTKILCSILLSVLTLFADQTTGDYQCRVRQLI